VRLGDRDDAQPLHLGGAQVGLDVAIRVDDDRLTRRRAAHHEAGLRQLVLVEPLQDHARLSGVTGVGTAERLSLQWRSDGVMNVVTTPITTTAENTFPPTPRAPPRLSVAPMPAKTSPTSPREITPTPTARRSPPGSSTPSPHPCFPTTAAPVSTA